MECDMPMKEGKNKKIEDYEVDSAMEALLRAEEIKGNPEMMALVQKKLASKKQAITSLEDLKAAKGKIMKESKADKKEDMVEGE